MSAETIAEARSVLLHGLDVNIGDATRVMQELADELEAAEAKCQATYSELVELDDEFTRFREEHDDD